VQGQETKSPSEILSFQSRARLANEQDCWVFNRQELTSIYNPKDGHIFDQEERERSIGFHDSIDSVFDGNLIREQAYSRVSPSFQTPMSSIEFKSPGSVRYGDDKLKSIQSFPPTAVVVLHYYLISYRYT
jgi:hypothetical protein